MNELWTRARDTLAHRILHVEDSPHRLAFGVFLGWVVGWSPTMGIQIALYLLIATLLRANKASGIPFLFISNPVTAVPLYYFAWWVGTGITGNRGSIHQETQVRQQLEGVQVRHDDLWDRIMTSEFWRELGQTIVDMGADLWLGSAVMGLATGVVGYIVTYRAVLAHRRRRAAHLAATNPTPQAPA